MAIEPIAIARKGALAYIGAIALTGDQVARTFDRLARRGEKAEQTARQRLTKVERTTREQLAKARESLDERQERVGGALEKGRDRLLEALSLPTQGDVVRLKLEIDRLTGVVEDLRKQARRPKVEVVVASNGEPPLPGYEKLNVESVLDRLPALDGSKLLAVRAYEQEHGKRVMVLRAVERQLVERRSGGAPDAPPFHTTVEPLPRYDELRAEEVVERLGDLGAAELLHGQTYEQQHQARVTVLRALDERLAARVEA